VFADECGIGARLTELVRESGHIVTTVAVGGEFAKQAEGVYTINPRRPADYNTLLTELKALGRVPDTVAHMWSVTRSADDCSVEAQFETGHGTGFYSLVFFAQAFAKLNPGAPLQIAAISNGVHCISGAETRSIEKATVLGPCKVIPQEYPNITCRSIDVDPKTGASSLEEKLARHVLTEIVVQPPELISAYRDNRRWVQIFEPIHLVSDTRSSLNAQWRSSPTAQWRSSPTAQWRSSLNAQWRSLSLRDEGVYLITGGLGGVGLVLAEHIAKTVRAKLVLLGRTPLPERPDWPRCIASPHVEDRVKKQIAKLQKLEAL